MAIYSIQDPASGKIVQMDLDHQPTADEIVKTLATMRSSGMLPSANKFLQDPNRKPASAEDFTPQPKPDAIDSLLSLLPAVGGAGGGIIGGIGGTVAGMGVGGVPGAIGGATVGGATGEAVRQLIERARGRQTPATPTAAAADIGTQGAEQGALEAGGNLAARYVVQPVARAVMRGYIKPSLSAANIGDARQIVQTALDEALPVTKGGEARAQRLIGELNQTINDTLDSVKGTVNLQNVANRVRAFARAKYFTPGVDPTDYKAAMEVADAIDQHASQAVTTQVPVTRTVTSPIVDASGQPITSEVHGTKTVTEYPTDVSATKANQIKQDVRPPSRSYGQQSYQPETVTRKVAGSQMRQAIENMAASEGHPEIAALNAREGRLIDVQDAIQRAAGREENKGLNPSAVPNVIAGVVGASDAAYQKDPASALAITLATRAALSPAVMTRAAILAYKLARNGYSVSNAARAAIALAQASGGAQQP